MAAQESTPTQRLLFKYTVGLWIGTAYWLIGIPVDPAPITRARRFVSTIRGSVLAALAFYWALRSDPLWQRVTLAAAGLTLAAVTRSMYTPSFAIDDGNARSFFAGSWPRRSKSAKYAAALLKVSANLTDVSTEGNRSDHAPLVLRRDRPDFQLRYVAFSLATAYYFAPFKRPGQDALDECARVALHAGLQEAWRRIARKAESAPENNEGFFTEKVDRAYCINEASRVMLQTVESWNHWGEHLERSGRDRSGTEMICRMLRAAESQNPPSQEDLERLRPLADWIEGQALAIGSAFGQIVR